MKFAIVLLVLLPLAFSNPIGDLFNQLKKDIHIDVLKENVNKIFATLGSDAKEAECEAQCHKVATAEVLDAGCPLFCKTYQHAVQHFHLG